MDPYHQKDILKTKNVQKQAARFVTNNYTLYHNVKGTGYIAVRNIFIPKLNLIK